MSEILEIPENFQSSIVDFANDLTNTFPEYSHLWKQWKDPNTDIYEYRALFKYCLTVYPERFFDLLYQNDDIFKPESTTNVMFLPNIDFKLLYNCEGVTENTQKSIWKYLQLIMFTLVGSIKNKNNFGESMNMFEGIDENDLQEKMKETIEGISSFFENNFDIPESNDEATSNGEPKSHEDEGSNKEEKTEFNFDKTTGMPNLENLHDHLKGLFDGKIGSLAKNIAEEISGDFESILGDDYKDISSTKDILQKMLKNPHKMMELIKKVGDKIKTKMDSGEISKDDIMREASDLLQRMKGNGGEGDDQLKEMFKTMARTMGGKGAKVDMNALERMVKQNELKERMRSRLNKKKAAAASASNTNYVLEEKNPNNYSFKLPEEGEQQKSLPQPKFTDEELIAEFDKSENNTQSKNEIPKSGISKKKKKGKK
jgi:hypothetical protein